MYTQAIGVLGGFGGYATLKFYEEFLKVFASESERNYPHIIFDNNFTMPSRTRALLYDEKDNFKKIVDSMTLSIKNLIDVYKVSKILLVCSTAHYFLDDVYKNVPEAKEKVINIIEATGEVLKEKKHL